MEVRGELSIDRRSVEEVHADLIHKRNQVHARQMVINDARALCEAPGPLNKWQLLEILNREVDNVDPTD